MGLAFERLAERMGLANGGAPERTTFQWRGSK